MADTFEITQPTFQGPFTLLLDAIKDQKIEVFEISLTEITSAFFEYLHKAELVDLDMSAEFLVMAAYLLELKSKKLLPQPETAELIEEEEEIEIELAKHLDEYRIFKQVAQDLKERKESFSKIYSRYHREILKPEKKDFFLTEISLEDLVKAFQRVYMQSAAEEKFVKIADEDITLPQRIGEVLEILKKGKEGVAFEALFIRRTRLEVVVTFLAILELARRNLLLIYQGEGFGNINLRLNEA